ncbi:CoB--CoM heterodisulfide reductase iron-sulfur subunit B family protein [Thermoflexus sp.]|uniref:CoB--CoM heterodisulfide reductase iron-sulfur subunit B family protein n=1 Tax=Thermoflexus sp. TaxID=1969742 RepID=UPI0025ED63E2|nr:CoB--CoM heterodisulfide reductase iron-sulfur subunit B family protein [Thermoflexus sp.]MCS6965094.1 CoB--CoM heterodisulfide reductase iron-sulfur subunit B family protein [Thermoflexus sp.]MCX7690545.1 CoB--CoM heterodisulfide reductase iron-sulfur subunit B family protein [Thermoflexus sp.]MDW8184843.1 CoB--CoM heterodisulfide reductase iron-sulfur subunit B family protein [Anaerolineae bacterium]
MSYLYFPGCSLKGTGRAYEESLLAVFRALGIPLAELADWNCCGATAYMSIDERQAFALAARNLALAEAQGASDNGAIQLIAPCSACYLVLLKAQRHLMTDTAFRQEMSGVLPGNMGDPGQIRIRHPLDVLVHDVGLQEIARHVRQPLRGLKVASYYGCQIVRPFALFDRPHDPSTMDDLVRTLGAEPVDWPLKTHCCGGSLTGTMPEVGLRLNYLLLREAQRRGADLIITVCPLCQFNLEAYQDFIRRRYPDLAPMPVLFFTQLIGMAMGLPPRELGLQRLLIPVEGRMAALSKEGAHARA